MRRLYVRQSLTDLARQKRDTTYPGAPQGNVVRLRRAFELLRFAGIGTLSFVLNYLIIVFLTDRVGLNYLISITVCFCTVTFVSFWLNRVWTFRKRDGSVANNFARYLSTAIVQLSLSLGACSICVGIFHMPYKLAVIALSIGLFPVSYLLHRRWSFNLRWLQHRP